MRSCGLVLLGVSLLRLASSFEFSVLVQNVKFISIVGGTVGGMNRRARKYGDLLLELGDDIPDIIGLTETFVRTPTDTLVEKLNTTHPFQLRLFPEIIPTGKFVESGLTLLSKYPIEAHEFRMFTQASGLDAFAAKGVLVAKIRLPASFAVVAITHLNSEGTDAVNTSQLGTIRDLIRDFVSRNIPRSAQKYTAVLGMGDYNIASDSETYKEILTTIAYKTEDPHEIFNPNENGFTYPTNNLKERIDYIFNLKAIDKNGCEFPSSNVTGYNVNDLVSVDMLSDHLGVGATISIGEKSDGILSNLISMNDSCNPNYLNSLSRSSIPIPVSDKVEL